MQSNTCNYKYPMSWNFNKNNINPLSPPQITEMHTWRNRCRKRKVRHIVRKIGRLSGLPHCRTCEYPLITTNARTHSKAHRNPTQQDSVHSTPQISLQSSIHSNTSQIDSMPTVTRSELHYRRNSGDNLNCVPFTKQLGDHRSGQFECFKTEQFEFNPKSVLQGLF